MMVTDTRLSQYNSNVQVHIKNLKITRKTHVLYRNDPIKIFHFLTHFVNEADRLTMSDAQKFITLPNFSADQAKTQFRADLSG